MTGFTVEEGGIRFGLVAVKNIGRGFIQAVVRQRQQDGAFHLLPGFLPADVRLHGHEQAGGGEPDPLRGLRQPGGQALPAGGRIRAGAGRHRLLPPEKRGGADGPVRYVHLPPGPAVSERPPAGYPGVHRRGADEHGEGHHGAVPVRSPHGGLPRRWPSGPGPYPSTPSWPISRARTAPSASPTARTSPLRESSPPAAPAPPATTPSWPM